MSIRLKYEREREAQRKQEAEKAEKAAMRRQKAVK